MMFEIDGDALRRIADEPVVQSALCDEFKNGAFTNTGTVTSTGTLDNDLLPPEALLGIRLSLLSFEDDWNAPGMEAYDAL